MKKRISILLIALFGAGCATESPLSDAPPTLLVDKTTIAATAAGDMVPVDVKSNSVWVAAVTAGSEWCKINPTAGSGNGGITIGVMVNTTPNVRTATVIVSAGTAVAAVKQTITVTQDAANATLTLGTKEIPATADMKTYPVDVISNDEWKATVTAGFEWCEVSPAQSIGNGIITVIVKENTTSNARSATVAVTAGAVTQTVTVTQAAPTPNANLTLDRSKIDAIAAVGTYSIAVTSNGMWTATVNEEADWCTISRPDEGPGNGTISVRVAGNNTPDIRWATITVTDGTVTRTVTVTQAAPAPNVTLTLDKPSIPAIVVGGTYPIAVTSNSTWTAAVSSEGDDTWCKISPEKYTGDGTITVLVRENATSAARIATITVTAGAVTKTVTVTQTTANATLTLDRANIPATAAMDIYSIVVTSNNPWTAKVSAGDESWCTIVPETGTGSSTITVIVKGNTTMNPREATITVTDGTTTKMVAVEQAAANTTLTLDKTSIQAIATMKVYSIAVTSNSPWTATVGPEEADWCTISPTTSTGNGTIAVIVAENPSTLRTATITVTAGEVEKTVTVTQAATADEFFLYVSPPELEAIAAGGTYSFTVDCNRTWTYNSSATWSNPTHIVSNTSGTKSIIRVNVAENTKPEKRKATITITAEAQDKIVTVWQDEANATLALDKTKIEATVVAAAYSIGVTSNSAWWASEEADWFTIEPATGTGNSSITVNVTRNNTTSTRSAIIYVSANDVVTGTPVTKTVTVTQAPTATLSLSPTTISVENDMGYYSPLNVWSNSEWTAMVTKGSDWCTIAPVKGSSNFPTTVMYQKNPTTSTREATIIFSAGTLTRTATVTQEAAPPTPPTLTLDKTQINAIAPASPHSIAVMSNSPWTATVSPSTATWCTLDTIPGSTGGGTMSTITVNVAKNDDATAARTAKITVTVPGTSPLLTQEVMVTQEKANMTLTVDLDKPTISAPASINSEKTIAVKSNSTWTATVSPTATWCTISPSTQTGDGTITVTMDENLSTSSTRTATITVTAGSLTSSVTVTQDKAVVVPYLILGRTDIGVVYASTGTKSTDSTKVVSNTVWQASVTNGSDWCKVNPTSGTGTGTEMITVERLTANTTASTRTATITVTAAGAPQTVTVTQARDPFINDMILVEGASGIQLGTETNVTLSDFQIGEHEVTQKQWQEVMGNNPSHFTSTTEDLPVENVSWNDVKDFLTKLNEQTGKNYRLPTEAEWEYAAEGGTARTGGLQSHYDYSGGNAADLDNIAWHNGNSSSTTHEVGTQKENELGIYDMSGNVAEWCSDWYDATSYPSGYRSGKSDPQGPASGSERVIRGGSWNDYSGTSSVLRTDMRASKAPDDKDNTIGFRVALSAP